jgi:MFS transporter, CP family, cyanate transporter
VTGTAATPARAPVRPAVVGVALVLLAANLRTTVASLPPLLGEIERDLALSGALGGLLTALPVLCMAWFAPAAHRLAHRLGREATALGAVGLVAAGNGLRAAGSVPPLLFGATLLAGLGVAVAGVVIPGLVKDLFHTRPGAVTGAYSVAMMLGAAVSATLTVPLRELLGSWQASLAAWAAPAVLAVLVWAPVTLRRNEHEPARPAGPGGLPWRRRPAWLLAGFFSLQAALAYAYMGWLPPAYEARGWSAAAAGALLGGHNLAQLAAALVLPALADRSDDHRRMLVVAVGCTAAGAAWLFALPDLAPWVASGVLGLGLGGGFSLALVHVLDYAADAAASSRLSAMVFLLGYTAAAVAPVVVGGLRDLTGGFAAPFGLLLVAALAQLGLATRLSPAHRSTVP